MRANGEGPDGEVHGPNDEVWAPDSWDQERRDRVDEYERESQARADEYKRIMRYVAGWNADAASTTLEKLLDGAKAILDAPDHVPAAWGTGQRVLHAEGEPLLITGPPGVAKTTLAQRYALARVGILEPELLGLNVKVDERPVLYLAADRPAQAMRSWRRMVTEDDRDALAERIKVHRGPLPFDLTTDPRALLEQAKKLGVGTVIVDSLKDVALDLVKDETGSRVNLAWQALVAEGIEVVALHHLRKGDRQVPRTVDDVYGSAWLTAGAGSVVLLWGEPGDMVIEARHLKQPAEVVGPLELVHDQERGDVTVRKAPDPLEFLRTTPGASAPDLARESTGKTKPSPSDIERARRQLERLISHGLASKDKDGENVVRYTAASAAWGVRDPSVGASVGTRDATRPPTNPDKHGTRTAHGTPKGGLPLTGGETAPCVGVTTLDEQRAAAFLDRHADIAEGAA